MNGSEKQVKWAAEIREKFIRESETYRARYERWSNNEKRSEEFRNENRTKLQIVVDAQKALENTDAKWWIENRDGEASIPAILNRRGGK